MNDTLRRILPLLLILLLALALRLINLNTRPVWYDEAFSILFARESLDTMLAGTLGTGDAAASAADEEHPLLYYTGLHGWQALLGGSPAGARSLSVLCGVLTVWVVYLLARRLFGDRRTALAAALLAAIAPFVVYYSQEARMYALLGLLAVTTTYFLVRAGQDPGRWPNWLAFALAATAMLYTHNLALFFLMALEIWVAVFLFDRSPVRFIILSHILIFILYLPWLLVLPRQLGKLDQAYWLTRPGLTELIQTLVIFHFGYDNQALPPWVLALALLFSLLIPALLVLVLRHRPAKAINQLPHRLMLLVLLAAGPVLLAFLVSQVRPVYVIRAFLPSALIYYGLVAYGFTRGGMPRPVKWGVAIPALALIALSLVNHYSYRSFPRSPIPEAVAYLAAADPGRIIHSNKLTYLPGFYYAPHLDQQFIADEPGSPADTLGEATQEVLGIRETADLITATEGAERVYLVIFQNAIDEFAAAGREHPHIAWLNDHYQQVSVKSFNDLLVIEYRQSPY